MIRSASEMRAAARASLSGKWGGAVMVTLVYLAVMGVLPASIDLKVYDGVGSIIQLVLIPLGWSISRCSSTICVVETSIRSGSYSRVFAITPVWPGR